MFKLIVLAALMAIAAAKPGGVVSSYSVAPAAYGYGIAPAHTVATGYYGHSAPLAYSAGYGSPYGYSAYSHGYNGFGHNAYSALPYYGHY